MKKLFTVVLACLVFQGCGDSSSDSVVTNTQLQSYELNATVTGIHENPDFNVTIGDPLVTTLSFNTDETLYDNVGNYPQVNPALFSLSLNDCNFSSVPTDNTTYSITVHDNYFGVDAITIVSNDPNLAAQYGVDEVRIYLGIADSSQQVFSNEKLPSTLDLNDFSHGYLEMTAVNYEQVDPDTRVGTAVWGVTAEFQTFELAKL